MMRANLTVGSFFDPMMRRRVRGYVRRKFGLYGERSYAQSGEDIILRHLFDILGIALPSYLDIGANQPIYLSNSYLFYRQGSRGICIEPDPALLSDFSRKRPRDTVFGVGVSDQPCELEFFVMSVSSLNTFSAEEACHSETLGHRIEKRLKIPVITVNEAFERCGCLPDFVSIDVEGLDEAVVASIDFDRFRPAAFCIETLTYAENGEGKKTESIFEIFSRNGFFPYADTHVNTIFVEERRWRKKGS
jgi:FkbM family methyltransferase